MFTLLTLAWMVAAMPAESPALESEVQKLASQDAEVRCAGAEGLCRLGEDAAPAAAALVRACGDDAGGVRDWAVAALEELGAPPNDQLDELAGLTAAPNVDISYWAVTLLGRAGEDAAAAAPALAEAVSSHQEAATRERAAWALGKIGPAAAAAVDELRAAAESDEPRLARLAGQALEKIGEQ
jgi:HEAT repeat protein